MVKNKILLPLLLIYCLTFALYSNNKAQLYISNTGNIGDVQIYFFDNGYNENNSKVYTPKSFLNLESYRFDNVYIIDSVDRFRFDYLKDMQISSFPRITKVQYKLFTKEVIEYSNVNMLINGISKVKEDLYSVSAKNDSYIEFNLKNSKPTLLSVDINYINIILLLVLFLPVFFYRVIKNNISLITNPEFYFIYIL